MGYFPSLHGRDKELYEEIKASENYRDIIRCIELDECFKSLDEDLGENWVFSHARSENLTYDYLARNGKENAEFYILRQIGNHNNELVHWTEQLNLLYKNWKELKSDYDDPEKRELRKKWLTKESEKLGLKVTDETTEKDNE